MLKPRKRAPGGGRKPKGEIAGKSALLSTRIRPDTRAMLKRAAKEAGRSVSQEAELRLIRSFASDALSELATHGGKDRLRAAVAAAVPFIVAALPDLLRALDATTTPRGLCACFVRLYVDNTVRAMEQAAGKFVEDAEVTEAFFEPRK